MSEVVQEAENSANESGSRRTRLSLSSLFLDPNNYRFIDDPDYRKVDDTNLFDEDVQRRTLRFLLGEAAVRVDDLIASLTENGWLDIEPIHVRRYGDRRFLVVEGNRRVATLKYLQSQYNNTTGQLGKLDPDIFKAVPCILSEDQDELHHLVVMGLHHISGKKRWPAINQARLMKRLRDEFKQDPGVICRSLGVSKREFNLSLRTLALTEAYLRSDYGDQFSSEKFNLFREVLKAPSLRRWLQWLDEKEQAVEDENLDQLFSWLSREPEPDTEDEAENSAPREPAITTGAQVRELARLIEDPDAVKRLAETRSLQEATLTSSLLVDNEIGGTFVEGDVIVDRLFRLVPRMSEGHLNRIDELINRLQGVAVAARRPLEMSTSARPWLVIAEQPKKQLTSLNIVRYRGLTRLELPELGRINLIVGVNNAGKTSLLEAIHLLAHQADPRGVLDTLRCRAHSESEPNPGWLVGQLPAPAEIAGSFDHGDDSSASVVLNALEEPEDDTTDRASYLRTLILEARYRNNVQRSTTDFFAGRSRRTRLEGEARWLCPSLLHSPFSLADGTTLTRCNDASMAAGTKPQVLEFIRKHIDPGLRNIELADKHDRFNVLHEEFAGARDLSAFGDGLQRIFQIGLLFAGARNGIVLLDEFENAVHAAVLPQLTRLVHELALQLNVQVFLTTHSKETVDAFVKDEYADEQLAAFLLSRQASGITVRRFGGASLRQAVSAINIDLRKL